MTPVRSRKAFANGVLIAHVLLMAGTSTAGNLGRYFCVVEEIQGGDVLGKAWDNAWLSYDADAGTLDVSLVIFGEREASTRAFSRLRVETAPSRVNNLHAVQYDSANPPNVTPVVAWLMLETFDNAESPRFQFFSTGIRAIATGKCARR